MSSDPQLAIGAVEVVLAGTPWRNITLVRVRTEGGLEGIGEATVEYREEAVAAHLGLLGARVAGLDATNQSLLWQTVVARDFMAGDAVATAAVSGLLTACLDITGKHLELPLYRLLGGPLRERVPVYANGWYQGERTPESFARLSQQVEDIGHRALKVDPFGTAGLVTSRAKLEQAYELVAAVRGQLGPDFEIYIDAHGRLSPGRAREAAQLLSEAGIGFLEEPVNPHNLAAMSQLRAAMSTPIAAGERSIGRWGFRDLIEHECVDTIQPDVAWCGGPMEAMRIAFLAEVHQMTVALHNANSPIATAAGCHVAAAMPNLLVLETFDDFDEPWLGEAIEGVPAVEDGALAVSNRPGLGVRVDFDQFVEHPPRRVFMDIEEEGWELRESEIPGGSA